LIVLMSLDLVVVPAESATDEDTVLAIYNGDVSGPQRAEQMRGFADEVVSECEADGRWPWTGPIDVQPTHVVLSPAWESWDAVVPVVASIAARHGLVTYDPQSSSFVPGEGYSGDAAKRWDILVIHPDAISELSLGSLREMRDRVESSVVCVDRLASFIEEAERMFSGDPWESRVSSSAAVLSIRLERWKEVARSVSEVAERHGLRAWVPDGNPMP
jgi:hypothetical protein